MKKDNVLDNQAFCCWFSGFADGESSFGIYFAWWKDKKGNKIGGNSRSTIFMFHIAQRLDNKPILTSIKKQLGVGRIMHSYKNGSRGAPQAKFVVSDLPSLRDVILPLFQRYPLRTNKKKSFEVFSIAVNLAMDNYGGPRDDQYWQQLDELAKELKNLKTYQLKT